jgi:ribosomal protein S18 acetylase RimI-like enzyme
MIEKVMRIKYQKLGPQESRQYREIRLESLKKHPESFGSSYEEQSKLPKLMFEEAIEKPYDGRFVIGVFDGYELIGICGFIPTVSEHFPGLDNAGTIIQMYVRSAYTGRKIGYSLIKTVVEEAFRLAYIDKIVLGVRENNISANRVYEQAGFLTYQPEQTEKPADQQGFRKMILHRGN